MEIKVRHTQAFVAVQVCDGQTTIDLGTLNEAERDELACQLILAAFEMGPTDYDQCYDWFPKQVARCGIESPSEPVDE